ncbi:thioredoxin domain-containing protein 17-like [Watersipora subatra]|uniref:thioredoxin domain-containing protein 17-like n=1 Tax=Watersipora subatra TaxID=2589382 RepID=UPI00355C9097
MSRRIKEICGIQGFLDIIDKVCQDKPVIFFSATIKETGEPWCPDCRDADPVVESVVGELNDAVQFIRVRVERPYWKEVSGNKLKSDYGVKCLPTLMRWGQSERLGEEECKNSATVSLFLKKQGV